MDKEELLEHIKKRDRIGEVYARIQFRLMKWMVKNAKNKHKNHNNEYILTDVRRF